MIRLGLVGCGAWGWRYIPSALDAGNAMVTCVSRVSSGISEAAKGHVSSLRIEENWEKMDGVDAVVVATPPDSHEEVCSHFLARGMPVMVEKPMTMRVGEAGKLRAAVRSAGIPFLVNHVHLFAPAYEELRNRFRSTAAGKRRVYGAGGSSGPFRSYPALWDYGPHDVSMCVGLGMGDPKEVTCVSAPDGPGFAFETQVRFEDGTEATVRSWNGSGPKTRRFETMDQGTHLVYDDLAEAKLTHNGTQVRVSQEKPLTRAVRAFAEAVRTGNVDWRFGTKLAERVTVILAAAEADQMVTSDAT